ncbi:hypothetical protein [Streptomyces omiyaensis]|uniref:Uncharacterized protein n=1 Tax=Streptomyces omiyaensis TaxID=68247 RepID=A0ABW7BXV9_9ACTN
MDEDPEDPAKDRGIPEPAEFFRAFGLLGFLGGLGRPGAPAVFDVLDVFGVDADWPESRQFTGHGHDRTTGDAHVSLWFGSPLFDAEVPHVTVFSGSSGNPENDEALERAFGTCPHPDGEAPVAPPPSRPVTLTADGRALTFELWRAGDGERWVARGRVGDTVVVLSGVGTEPGELRLTRVTGPAGFTTPFAPLG